MQKLWQGQSESRQSANLHGVSARKSVAKGRRTILHGEHENLSGIRRAWFLRREVIILGGIHYRTMPLSDQEVWLQTIDPG